MNINRLNYEEYFLLYVDNELNAVDREAVEVFVQENPDLREELNMLSQAVVRIDKKIVFDGKSSLMRNSAPVNPVNESNYEEYFLLYADNELSNEEKDLVEQFVYKNSQFQLEFELLQKVHLNPDNSIVFPDKQSLYRSEKDERVIVIRWWKIAAAAVVVLMLGAAAWMYFDNDEKIKPETIVSKEQPTPSTILPDSAVPESIDQKNLASAELVNEDTQSTGQESAITKADKKNNTSYDVPGEHLIADNTPKEKKINSSVVTSNNSEPSHVPHIDGVVAKVEPSSKIEVTKSPIVDTEVSFETLNVNDPKPMEASYASNTDDGQIEVLNTTVSNKSKMRGLFRKVGRVVGKATNIGPSDESEEKKGIRIASFQIALK